MQFEILAKVKNWLGREKTEDVTFSADNAEKARELVEKKFPRAQELILYQLLGQREDREYFGQKFSRVWNYLPQKGWTRDIPGKGLELAVAPDEATDQELLKRYLDSLS